MDDATAWEIEDLTEANAGLGVGRTTLWIGVLLAVLVAIVGFGFIGRTTSEEAIAGSSTTPVPGAATHPRDLELATTSSDPLVVTAPREGAGVAGGVVKVEGMASRALGTVHLAVRLGNAVLGWANVEVAAAGPMKGTVHVFAPAFDVPVELRIDSAGSVGRPGVALVIRVHLNAAAGVGLWSAGIVDQGSTPVVVVHGYANRSDGTVDVQARASDARVLGATRARIVVEQSRPGSAGGSMIGLGSFTARVPLSTRPVGPVIVQAGSATLTVSAIGKPPADDGRR
jgi:hypothetical protein